MIQDQIRDFVADRTFQEGLTETGVAGVQLFRATQAIPCSPAVYEPCVVAIASGSKEAILDGRRYVYDDSQYMCCPMSMPVKAGTPDASETNPLYGVYISLNPRVMGEIAIEMANVGNTVRTTTGPVKTQAIAEASWDPAFGDALLRLLKLTDCEEDAAVLGDARLRELYYAILKGSAGHVARQAFGVGNAIARAIAHVSANLDATVSIEEMAMRAGMSRAVFHRKFKQTTTMSPIQFVKTMRLNNAAMRMRDGLTVSEAAMDVGYVSASQFSREFKRVYGQSPKGWIDAQRSSAEVAHF